MDDIKLIDYMTCARRAAQRKENMDIFNSSLDHAINLTDLLFNNAEKNVKILTGTLNELFYNDSIINKFRELIRKDVSIKIIIWHKITANKFLTSLTGSDLKDKIEIREANLDDVPDKHVKHFTVVDDTAYRWEELHNFKAESKENYKVKATVNYGNPEIATFLSSIFDDAWPKCRKVS